jgi:FkbM family methyltransferase
MDTRGISALRLLQRAGRKVADRIGRDSAAIRRLRPLYEAVMQLASGDRGVPWTINGAEYRIDPRQRHRLGAEYDAPVAAFLREHLRPGSTCFDVGANVGVYVLQFARWTGPDGKVIAFEPNPDARAVLQKHIRMNGLESRARVVPAAVGARKGEAILFASGADGMSRMGAPNALIAASVREVSVPVTTLDAFIASERLVPDWVLIDIEGFEIAALQGARELLRSPSVGVVVEMHPSIWDSAGTSRAEAERVLAELERTAVPLTGQVDPLAEHGLVHLKPTRL